MTAEIAVMNQHGVALAADSAVTLTGGELNVKIFTSANKIFTASKYEPVGVMIYGSASVMRMPWETLVKVFRAELGERSFNELPEYATYFFDWLRRQDFVTRESEELFLSDTVGSFVAFLKGEFTDAVSQYVEQHGEIDVAQSRRLLSSKMDEAVAWIEDMPVRQVPAGFAERLLTEFRETIDQTIEAVFEEFPLTGTLSRRLRQLAIAPVLRVLRSGQTGLVFAGYGDKDLLPRLYEYHVDGLLLGEVIASERRVMDVTSAPEGEAFISGFAQDEMIRLFMEGVLPTYEEFVENYLHEVIDRFGGELVDAFGDSAPEGLPEALDEIRRDVANQLSEDLRSRRYEESIEPVLDIVASLPKDELAALAESLVNLTSLKKRISRDDETVGGPVDVAVISKGDGLTWIKRKHYFQADLNPHFFANYFRHPRYKDPDD